MEATVGPSKVVQGLFNQGNALGIQCACMTLFAISYLFINVI